MENIITQPTTEEQLVEAGVKDGIRHEVIKDAGHGEYYTRCGERIAFRNLIVMQLPRKMLTCKGCELGNDADFKARKGVV